jgi:uncharacterized protein (DUF1697 family)
VDKPASTIAQVTAAKTKPGARRQTWVALLRGVNLGERNKLSMRDLRGLFVELGHADVETYLQSGNVLFRSPAPRRELTQAIAAGIRGRFGLDVSVILRTRSELRTTVEGNGFAGRQSDPTKLHVTFLATAPRPERVAALETKRFEPDEFRVTRGAVYLHCPQGYGRSKLSNAFFEQQLGVVGTTRNWRTVTALAELAGA